MCGYGFVRSIFSYLDGNKNGKRWITIKGRETIYV